MLVNTVFPLFAKLFYQKNYVINLFNYYDRILKKMSFFFTVISFLYVASFLGLTGQTRDRSYVHKIYMTICKGDYHFFKRK